MDLYEPKDIEHYFDKIYEDPSVTTLHEILLCIQYTNGRAKRLYNDVVSYENDQGLLVDCPLKLTNQTLKKCAMEQFPSLPVNIVKAAVRNWRNLVKKTWKHGRL